MIIGNVWAFCAFLDLQLGHPRCRRFPSRFTWIIRSHECCSVPQEFLEKCLTCRTGTQKAIAELEISGSTHNIIRSGIEASGRRSGGAEERVLEAAGRTQLASAPSESRNEAARKVEKKKRGRPERYPKTPRAIYHAQRAQQEAELGMLMWAAGAGSRYACATPRGANHRPRNGSCARVSSSRAPYNLGKMEEESHGSSRTASSSIVRRPAPSCPASLLPFRHWTKRGGGRRRNEATARKSESNER